MTQRGFTLIELVAVIMIIAIASVPLFGQFTQATASLLDDEKVQTAVQLVQERAEEILALRRRQGFAAVPNGTITETSLTGNYGNYSRTLVVSQLKGGPGCFPSAVCKEVVITVSRDATPRAQATFMLVDY